METLTFTLKQHTPMLHFQASQEGATLRASDVKPRFDRWLIKEVWDDNFDKCCPYLVGYSDKFSEKQREDFKKKFEGGFRALNYKMRIDCFEDRTHTVKMDQESADKNHKLLNLPLEKTLPFPSEDHSLVMSNIGGRLHEEVVNFVFYDHVEVKLFVEQVKLSDAIKDNFAKFISSVNFGNRKSKGFGSFIVTKKNGEEVFLDELYDTQWIMYVTLEAESETEINVDEVYRDIFTIIDKIWRELKKNYKGKRKDIKSVLLGRSNEMNFLRIPSPITFKPIIVEKTLTACEFAIGFIYEKDVITKGCQSGTETVYNKYINKVKGENLVKSLTGDKKIKLYNVLQELTIE